MLIYSVRNFSVLFTYKLSETGKINYIPSFLVLDQPSQVYFPEGFPKEENEPVVSDETQPGDNAASATDAATDKKETGAEEPKEAEPKKRAIPSEDICNTTAIFEACSQFLTRTNFKTQIIILEHASKSTWKGIENIYQAEEWRGNLETDKEHFDALIPLAWLES